MEYEKLRSMPKVELHCHLDGSLSRSFISQELGREVDPTELQVAYGCRSLKEYLEKFDLPVQCLQSEKSMRKAGYDFIRSVAAENMKYVEVRFAPLFLPMKDFPQSRSSKPCSTAWKTGGKILAPSPTSSSARCVISPRRTTWPCSGRPEISWARASAAEIWQETRRPGR